MQERKVSLLLDHVLKNSSLSQSDSCHFTKDIFFYCFKGIAHNEYPSTRKYVNANTNKQKIINQKVIFKRLGLLMLFHLFFNSCELDATLTNDPYRISLH